MPDLATHHASVMVNAPVQQVYAMFTHFNDFPKFMSFVKEVTYYDNQRSHWVADVVGQHEWDAINENWVPNRQIGWHSTKGLENFGKVTFEPMSQNQTRIDVYINYNPPVGILGDIGENLGVGNSFETHLQNDLNHFARMVDQAPANALDPNTSNYLFHGESAASQGKTTDRQNQSMQQDPGMNRQQDSNRPLTDQDITGKNRRDLNSDYTGLNGSNIGVPGQNLPPTANRDTLNY